MAETDDHTEGVDWTVSVTEPLPNSPSVKAAWERIAIQTSWNEWRGESTMRKRGVLTTLVSPATEPLTTGDEYIVQVGLMKIHCHVLESPGEHAGKMVFDSMGVACCGMVRARFRFTVFQRDNIVMAMAQEQIMASCSFLMPPKSVLESEHRHTLKELDKSFIPY